MSIKGLTEKALEQGKGILRLAPNWVPRSFCVPGRRIRLHPDDYYAMGGKRGGINERWFASTTSADNGLLSSANEGLSVVVCGDGEKAEQVLLRDAVDEIKGQLIGDKIWNEYGYWPMYAKFFDNQGALPHHIHHRNKHAAAVNQREKPEAYYFPPQVNNHCGEFPYTFFGFEPGTTKEQVRECLVNFEKGDNKITTLSRAFRLDLGTGWDIPPGILHAPGSLCTYEPQKASDVFAMYQSLVGNQIVPHELLWKNTPQDKVGNVDYLMEVIDWELNLDPEFGKNHLMIPRPVKPVEEMKTEGYIENWICYKSSAFSAKELTVLPSRSVTIKDSGAYGLMMLQGYGRMGVWDIETPTLIRYRQLTNDEFFVSETSAKEGVKINNLSSCDPIVMLKHFGPQNTDLPQDL